MSLPIFDSLAHPTLTGTWLGNEEPSASFDELDKDMRGNGFARACAVGMWGHDGYQHEPFMASCRRYPNLVPVAGYLPEGGGRTRADLDAIHDLGYAGIKIHPRFSQIDLGDVELLATTFEEAARRELTVFFCTYQHSAVADWPDVDPLGALVRVLKAAPNARVVLVHGGDVELLRYMQLVRFNERLLLDLSQTLCKYPGSSLDLDLGFLFRHFDRRICIGTDWPQHGCAETRGRFELFSREVSEEKCANIASRNLAAFLGQEI